MKTAFKNNTIKQIPNTDGFGTLLPQLTGDLTPTLERALPPTADAQLDYSNKLLPTNFPVDVQADGRTVKNNFVVTLVSSTITAEPTKRMRVRQGKAGPNGKQRPTLDMLAKAEVVYGNKGSEHIKKNTGFNQFTREKFKTVHKGYIVSFPDFWQDDKFRLTTEPDIDGMVKLKCITDVNKNTVKYAGVLFTDLPFPMFDKHGLPIVEYTVHANDESKRHDTFVWKTTQHLKTIKHVRKINSVAFADENILETTNSLLRQIMLFKGIGFVDVERDVAEAGKPVTYLLNTAIEYDKLRRNEADLIKVFKVHKVTVKKTFRELVDGKEQCKIFFSGDSCKHLTMWLKSLKVELN